MTKRPKSRAAAAGAGLYLIVSLAALVLLVTAGPGENLAGVYIVFLAKPWSTVLVWVINRLGTDSLLFNSVFLLLGVLVNAALLYWCVSLFSRRRS